MIDTAKVLRGAGAAAQAITTIFGEKAVGDVVAAITGAAADALQNRGLTAEQLIESIQRARPVDFSFRDEIDKQIAELP